MKGEKQIKRTTGGFEKSNRSPLHNVLSLEKKKILIQIVIMSPRLEYPEEKRLLAKIIVIVT